jgi:hypothetical protein
MAIGATGVIEFEERQMKAWFGVLAMVAVMAAASQPAAANPRGFGPWLQAQAQPQPPERTQRDPREQRRDPRVAPQRDQSQRSKLTDEERRGLRRDIDQANRDIYRQQRNR